MPELPEVETVCRGLRPVLEGRIISEIRVLRAKLRIPVPAALAPQLEGRRIQRLSRRAKYILMDVEGGQTMILHLGMSGRIRHVPGGLELPLQRHDHLVVVTERGGAVIFNDTRRFGLVTLAHTDRIAEHPLLSRLGPEPLSNRFNGPELAARLKGRKTPVKTALLDQTTVAGLGNIYACEALHRARLSPRRLTYTVQGGRAERLALAVRAVLDDAIAAGGSTLRDYARLDGELGYFQHDFRVYDRQGSPCPTPGCSGIIGRIVQSGRSTFFCSRCQR